MRQRANNVIALMILATCAVAHAGTLVLREGVYTPLAGVYQGTTDTAISGAYPDYIYGADVTAINVGNYRPEPRGALMRFDLSDGLLSLYTGSIVSAQLTVKTEETSATADQDMLVYAAALSGANATWSESQVNWRYRNAAALTPWASGSNGPMTPGVDYRTPTTSRLVRTAEMNSTGSPIRFNLNKSHVADWITASLNNGGVYYWSDTADNGGAGLDDNFQVASSESSYIDRRPALTIRYRSPVTRAVVDAADYSVNNGMGYIGDPTRDNASGSFSWGEAYLLKTYNTMYRATGDRLYLNKFITHADGVLAKRNDIIPINTASNSSQSHYKVNGQDVVYDKPLWAMAGHGYTSASATSGHIVQGMARFARIVHEDPALAATVYDPSTGQTYGQKARHYIDESLLTLDAIDDLLLISTPHGTAYKAYPDGSPFAPPGYVPTVDAANADAPPSGVLFDLYKATGNIDFLSRAQRTMRTLRAEGVFVTEQGNLAWSYGYGPPPQSDPEDVSHGGLVAPVIATMANDRRSSPGLYNSQDFTPADAMSFARAYMREGYLGNGYSTSGMEGSHALEDRFNNPDMDPAEWASGVAGGMIDLAQFDLRLLPIAEAVQLRYYGLDNRPPTTSNNPVAWPVEGYANLFRYSFVPQELQIDIQATDGQAVFRTSIPAYADLSVDAELFLVNDADFGDVRRLLVTLGGSGSEWDRLWSLNLSLDASAAEDLLGHDVSLTLTPIDGRGGLKQIFGAAPPEGFDAHISASGHQIIFDGILSTSGTFTFNANEQDIALDLPGDADLDGDVDLSDLGVLATYYGQPNDMLWPQGDFDLDGDVDLADLGTLATNYNGGYSQALSDFHALNVPEPALAIGLLAIFLRRSR